MEKSVLQKKLLDIYKQLPLINKGENLLVKESDSYFLLKYDGGFAQFLDRDAITYRIPATSCKYGIDKTKRFSEFVGEINIEGSHLLRFDYNKKFDEFFPSSENQSVVFAFDEKAEDLIELELSRQSILETMSQIVPPIYFEEVITPFVEETPTKYKMPHWITKNHNMRNRRRVKFYNKLEQIEQGEHAYIGSKEEVWLVTRCAPEKSSIYTDQYNNPLFFTNSLLNGADFHFFQGEDYKNFCSIKGKPFVSPSIGLGENCYINLMRGKPQLFTKNLDDALKHFSKTDFFEFRDVVEQYFKGIDD